MGIKLYALNLISKIKGDYLIITFIEVIIIILFGSIITNDRTKTIQVENEIMSEVSDENLYNECKEIYTKNKELLILVNYDNAVPNDYKLDLRYTENRKEQVANVLYNDLVLMLRDAQNVGYTYWIASGYRSIQIQQGLIDDHINTYISEGMSVEEAKNKTYEILEKANYSEHHTGLAIDFLSSDNLNMDESQEMTEGNKWLRENCYKYGFILRYPRDRQAITNMSYEPWHFRYVGREASTFIHQNNLTLEEFYAHL